MTCFKKESTSAPEILNKVHQSNLAEIRAGELAKKKGSSLKIRNLGRELSIDHAYADQKLMQIAKQENIRIISSADTLDKDANKAKKEVSQLESLQGKQFGQSTRCHE